MKQTAEVLVHCHPNPPVLEDVLNAIATNNHLPDTDAAALEAKQEALDTEWNRFWRYVEHVNPDMSCHLGHVHLCHSH